MRAVWVFAPIAALALFVAARALFGKPLSRRALDIAIALLLLGYLMITAGLGLFWVARMDLPVFDWHYLFGYALLVVAAAHVSLQLRGLYRFFFRRRSASAAEKPRSRLQAGGLTALLGAAVIAVLGLAYLRAPNPASRPAAPARTAPAAVASVANRGGSAIVDRLYRESSYSRAGLFRSVGLAPERPSDTKPYEGRPRLALPAAAGDSKTTLGSALRALQSLEPSAGPPPSLAQLATLLYFANGVTAEIAGLKLRAAASSGALYPTDVYVEPRGVFGLAPGIYYYDGPAHALVLATRASRQAELREALRQHPTLDHAPLRFVFGSTFDRTAWKYNVRSYRYLGLDAGHVALNLALAAAALGVPCEPEAFFDDGALGAGLELDAEREAPMLVLTCGSAQGDRPAPVTPRHEPPPVPPDAGSIELTRLSASLTAVRLTGGFDWQRAPPVERTPGEIALPAPLPSERELFEVIRSRRSFREFDARAVSAQDLSNVLGAARTAFGWLRSVPLVELFVAVRAVGGLAPGSYRYDSERHALAGPIRTGTVPIEAAGLDQGLLGRAAFVLAWALIGERAGQFEGARDFRHAALEAGLSGEAVYLSASAAGLAACGVGAFYDEEVGALFSTGKAPRIVHLTAVGARPER